MLSALATASIILTFLRYADRIKIGCMTGGINSAVAFDREKTWRNASYYPYAQLNKLSRGAVSLMPAIDSPTYNTEQYALTGSCQSYAYEDVQSIESAVVHNEEKGETSIFLINRAVEDDIEVTLDVRGFEGYKLAEHIEMYSDDLYAENTYENPDTIKPLRNVDTKMEGGKVTAVTKKLSWNVIRLVK
jgi:alpha-N-arabinofuranosidase